MDGFIASARDYDYINGMWGETDDEKNWRFRPAVLQLALIKTVPAIPLDIPRERKLASC